MANIKSILKENGLEIVRHIEMKHFRLKFTKEELQKKKESTKNKLNFYDYDLEGEFNVEISEIGFNGDGGLYIVLTCTDDEHFKDGDTFEVIEYDENGKVIII